MDAILSPYHKLWIALLISSGVGVLLFLIGALRNHSVDYWYLMYNLTLALIPLLLATALQLRLQKQKWTRPLPIILTILWVLFLPNSFYVISDFIHLKEVARVDIVQDVVMLAQFSFTAWAFGYVSLFIVHKEFMKRVSRTYAVPCVLLLLLLCSFAIYLGRDLRWNSWDVITQPLSLSVEIIRRIIHPVLYYDVFSTTLSFFVMISSIYLVLWRVGEFVEKKEV